MRMNKRIYNYIDFELSNYKLYEKKIEEIRKDIIDQNDSSMDGQPKAPLGSKISDQTLSKVIQLNTPLAIARMEQNKECIDRALKKLDEDHKKFFNKNYIETDGTNRIKVCYEMPISERTYFRMRSRIIELVGKEMGII